MFKNYKDSDNWNNYYDTLVLDSGQTIKIVFQEYNTWHKWYYNIYLVTSHKRKHEDKTYLKNTGKDGLKGLLWAKQKVQEFEKFIAEEHNAPIIIYCTWDDNRRRNTYEYGLKKLGYKFDMVLGKKSLCKTVRR